MTAAPRADLPDTAPHVLVVDDDRRLRELLARYLTDQGFRVTVAASAAEGLALARSVGPKLILLDYVLPDRRGAEVCADLSADPVTAGIPVVVIDGQGLDRPHGEQDSATR